MANDQLGWQCFLRVGGKQYANTGGAGACLAPDPPQSRFISSEKDQTCSKSATRPDIYFHCSLVWLQIVDKRQYQIAGGQAASLCSVSQHYTYYTD